MIETMNRYGRTAARNHDADGLARRPSSVTIDIHAHIVVPQAAAHAPRGLVKWSSDSHNSGSPATGGWQDRLRAHFGLSPTVPGDSGQHDTGDD